ncbi:MAG: hypothetical protein JSS44_01405 [Proteobacteria bacterium]|nr:hypothetical protein [Pseudomonadota bacterium]
MAAPLHQSTLRNLRNTRDLRAEIVSLAAQLAAAGEVQGRMIVIDPAIHEATIRKEWDSLMPAIAPSVRARMHLDIERSGKSDERLPSDTVPLERPNFRYEILRLLIEADLRGEKMSVKQMIGSIEASQTPVRTALEGLRSAGMVEEKGATLYVRPEDVTTELLAKAGAVPTTLRFRFEQGARIKPPAHLLQRCLPLLKPVADNSGWGRMALSGVAAAREDVPALDLIGLPRLDLVAQLSHRISRFETGLLRQLDDGLEYEPSVLVPAPVVITIVRAKLMRARHDNDRVSALKSDVFLSLLDIGLRDQALQYARAVRE